jgi:hypothetical protein
VEEGLHMTHPVALWILTGRPRKLLVIVNPFGGKGAGKTIFVQIVEPMLQAARIAYAMKGANQALFFPFPLLSSLPFLSQICWSYNSLYKLLDKI